MAEDVDLMRGKSVVAVIDFHETKIFPTDATPGERPEHIVAPDPHGNFQKIHHRAGNPKGTYEADDPKYWREITDALAPAGEILILGHGGGKANASHHWVAYVEKHRPDVASRILADIRIDIDHLDNAQVLRLAQYIFGAPPLRVRRGATQLS